MNHPAEGVLVCSQRGDRGEYLSASKQADEIQGDNDNVVGRRRVSDPVGGFLGQVSEAIKAERTYPELIGC